MIPDRWLAGLSIATGVVLFVIGVRFGVVPDDAADFFGLDTTGGPHHLHYVVAVRDLWLAVLLIGFGVWRDWRALALTLAPGALVCFADSLIVARATGWPEAVAFHAVSGCFCTWLAWLCWRRWVASRSLSPQSSQ